MTMEDISSPELVKRSEEFVEMIKNGTIKNIHLEKPMKDKVIFESVQQMLDFMNDCIYGKSTQNTIILAKEKGYIRKSAVEIAEEMYKEYVGCHLTHSTNNDYLNNTIKDRNKTIEQMYKAIQELKAEKIIA